MSGPAKTELRTCIFGYMGEYLNRAVPSAAHDRTLVILGRRKARVAALTPERARTVALANEARILQGRASTAGEVNMKGEAIYIGIDVAKDRLDVAVRPKGKGWSVFYEDREVEKLVASLQ